MCLLLQVGVGFGNNDTTILGLVRETESVPAQKSVAGSCLRLTRDFATSIVRLNISHWTYVQAQGKIVTVIEERKTALEDRLSPVNHERSSGISGKD